MSQTVIGMFDDASEAQQAIQALVNAGISRDRIDLSANSGGMDSSAHSTFSSAQRSHSDDHENGITRFFKNLFGDDDDDADKYTSVASKANSIVTVHAQSRDEAETAADLLDDNGAIDVDEKATAYGYSGGSSGYSNTPGSGTNTKESSNIVGDYEHDLDEGGYKGSAGKAGTGYSSGTSAGMSGAGSTADDFETGSTSDVTGRNNDLRSDYAGDNDLTGTEGTRQDEYGSAGAAGITGRQHSESENTKIQIIEENLEIGKRQVNTGGVRLRSRIVERPVEESIRLREERVNIERNTVDRPATDADFASFEETEIEMVERAEVPVVNKQARVVEEVSLNKEVEERSETIHDTVRRTEVDVENLDKDNSRSGLK